MTTRPSVLLAGDAPEYRHLCEDKPLDEVRVTCLKDPEACLDHLAENEVWVLVVEASLTGALEGHEVVRRSKDDCAYRTALMLGGPADVERVEHAYEVGLDDHLIRGDDAASNARLLVRRIRRALELYDPRVASLGHDIQTALHHAIYQDPDESILLVNRDGRILYFNERAQTLCEELFGRPMYVGASLYDFVPEDARDEVQPLLREYVAKAFDGQRTRLMQPLVEMAEPAMSREYLYAPVFGPGGEVLAAIVTSRDIGAEIEARAQLEQSEARFWELVERMPLGVGIIDADKRWVRANPALCEMLGYDESQILGHTPGDFIHPEDRRAAMEAIDRLQDGQDEVLKRQRRMLHRDGHIVWTDVTGVALGGQAQPERYVGIISDITPRKELEQQLQEMEKMRVIGQLAGGIAHDFNNLLTVINSYTHYAMTDLGADHPIAFALNKVLGAAKRGSTMVDQLLAFSRRQVRQPAALDLNSVITDIDGMFDRVIGPDIELRLDLSDEVAPIWFDHGQLEQVLVNLVLNARDAMAGGGELVIRTRQTHLEQPVRGHTDQIPAGDWVVLEVCDTGHGIQEEVLDHIFEPFFTTKEFGQGTGLGLSSAWGVVTQGGGHVDVDSTPGEGTTFSLYLPPTTEAPDEHSAPEELNTDEIDTGATVLLVEDNDDVRESLVYFLGRQGYQVFEAANADEALDLLDTHDEPIEVMLCDVVMPGMQGDQLAEQVAGRRPDTHILLMSGFPGKSNRLRNLAWELIGKPIDLGELSRKLREAVS